MINRYQLTVEPQDSEKFIHEFLKFSSLRAFEKDSFIYEQGEKLENFYLILEGMAETFKNSNRGQQKNYGLIGPNTLLGMSSLDGYEMHASVRCKTKVLTAIMPKERLSLWNRDMFINLIKIQTDKSKALLHQLICEYTEETASRIARFLLEIGNPDRKHQSSYIPSLSIFNCRELADHVNASPTRVMQILRKMENDGAVQLQNKAIIYFPYLLEQYLKD